MRFVINFRQKLAYQIVDQRSETILILMEDYLKTEFLTSAG